LILRCKLSGRLFKAAQVVGGEAEDDDEVALYKCLNVTGCLYFSLVILQPHGRTRNFHFVLPGRGFVTLVSEP